MSTQDNSGPDPVLPLSARIEELSLYGHLPDVGRHSPKTKIGRLEAMGWKILPIPQFWAPKELWHGPDTGKGNPAAIDFEHAHEWLVIPADENARAFKVGGRICAIRKAWKAAGGGPD